MEITPELHLQLLWKNGRIQREIELHFNTSCVQGEPMPAIQWWREDYEFRGGELKQVLNNETFKIFEMGKNSALQVSLFLVSI